MKNSRSRPALIASLITLLLTGCATTPDRVQTPITNPVLDSNFPDPTLIKASDGYYYAYATQGEVRGQMHNIQAARSRDLATWEQLGDALPQKPVWASRTQDFWAPHVAEHDGRFYLYYSAKPDIALEDGKSGLCLAVATADAPKGPFRDIGKPLQCGDGFINIDPMSYDDPASGKRLLYWGSGFGPIKVRELAADRISFKADAPVIDLVPVIANEDPANYQRLVEGAWVVRRDGYYYLFYSGDNCCGPKAHYAVMVARSRSAIGPFETLAQATGKKNSVILKADKKWIAPGHNSIIEDASGRSLIVYHAINIEQSRESDREEVNSRRVMLLAEIHWRDG
jgi:arabinan endo-1,5-alpha-L-arabinosidase